MEWYRPPEHSSSGQEEAERGEPGGGDAEEGDGTSSTLAISKQRCTVFWDRIDAHPSPVSDRGYSTTAGSHIRRLPSHFPGGQSSRNLAAVLPQPPLERAATPRTWRARPLRGRGIAQQPPSVWTSPRPWATGCRCIRGSRAGQQWKCKLPGGNKDIFQNHQNQESHPASPSVRSNQAARASPERLPRFGRLGR